MALLLTVLAVFLLLVASEIWWRKQKFHGEFSRKFIHITVGSFVAFWPYFLTKTEIILLSLAFLLVVGISKYFGIFQAIHSVQRPTWGEVWFAVVVGVLALCLGHPHIYTVALLVMSLADGMAAVVGTRYGRSSRYTIFGALKSLVGTTTFFIITLLLLANYNHTTPEASLGLWIVPVALVATLLENVAIDGLDNLLVPLATAGLLLLFV